MVAASSDHCYGYLPNILGKYLVFNFYPMFGSIIEF